MLVREAEKECDIIDRISSCIKDDRRQYLVDHSYAEMIPQKNNIQHQEPVPSQPLPHIIWECVYSLHLSERGGNDNQEIENPADNADSDSDVGPFIGLLTSVTSKGVVSGSVCTVYTCSIDNCRDTERPRPAEHCSYNNCFCQVSLGARRISLCLSGLGGLRRCGLRRCGLGFSGLRFSGLSGLRFDKLGCRATAVRATYS